MKNPLLLSALIILSACGKPKSATLPPAKYNCQTLAGEYISAANFTDTLTIRNDCTFTDSHCEYSAYYSVPTDGNLTTITVLATNGTPACMSSSDHACSIKTVSSTGKMDITCIGYPTFEFYDN